MKIDQNPKSIWITKIEIEKFVFRNSIESIQLNSSEIVIKLMMGTNGFRQKCVTKEQKLKKIKEKKSEKKEETTKKKTTKRRRSREKKDKHEIKRQNK